MARQLEDGPIVPDGSALPLLLGAGADFGIWGFAGRGWNVPATEPVIKGLSFPRYAAIIC